MTDLSPLEPLYDSRQGEELRLPDALARLVGSFPFPTPVGRPYVIANFVSTLDGVTSLGIPGQAGGGPISGDNQHDRLMMGLLRAASDAVIVGAGTLRSVPNHVWTPDHVAPSFAGDFQRLREQLKKRRQPLNVIVTAAGNLDPALPVFQRGAAPVLIATTREGARRIADMDMPPSVQTAILADEGPLRPSVILNTVSDACGGADRILVEGGPQLLGDFLAEGQLDELFLTVAPQVAGRSNDTARPGVVSGQSFAPDSPVWATLVSVKRADSALFLRYAFSTPANSSDQRIPNVRNDGEPT